MTSLRTNVTDCPPDVLDAYERCATVTRARARNFYYGLRLTPEPKRSSLYALYAWMRRADDLVDDAINHDAALVALDKFQQQTETLLKGRVPSDQDPDVAATWIAFADTLQRYPIPPTVLHDMINGQRADLDEQQAIDTFDDLYQYCVRVAGSVGQACISIWGFDGDDAHQLAEERGVAFQLTNILRDVVEDIHDGRLYLPESELAASGLTRESLCTWDAPDACASFIQRQVERAESYYARSKPLDAMVHSDGVPTLRAMTRIYHGLLEQIARDPHRVVGQRRVQLTGMRKTWIALTSAWGARARRGRST